MWLHLLSDSAQPQLSHDVSWHAVLLAKVNFRVRLFVQQHAGTQPQEVEPWGARSNGILVTQGNFRVRMYSGMLGSQPQEVGNPR